MATKLDQNYVKEIRERNLFKDGFEAMVLEVERLEAQVDKLEEVSGTAQAVLTALNIGSVQSESLLHKHLREVMIKSRQ